MTWDISSVQAVVPVAIALLVIFVVVSVAAAVGWVLIGSMRQQG